MADMEKVMSLCPGKAKLIHNCFARIKDRMDLLDAKASTKFKIQLRAFYQLEKEIFQVLRRH